jgi:hypothetical protein
MFLPVGGVKKLKNESFCTVFVIELNVIIITPDDKFCVISDDFVLLTS